ncbi:ras GEF [Peniophora sp. CONT]|nr:ras GEF [Peniophora sp. CONT]
MSASEDEGDGLTTFFCRALYDYSSTDESALSFRRGAVIEVLTRLESGWWDGLLGDERGWFPSNYVQIIDDDEADAALAEAELASLSASQSFAPSSSSQSSQHQQQHEHYPHQPQPPIEHPVTSNDFGSLVQESQSAADFWVPQVTPSGQIFYLNTVTGEHARDLPADDDALPGPDTPLPTPAGFGVQRRGGTPEPWRRRLADDGLTYFYVNGLTGETRWSAPEAPGQHEDVEMEMEQQHQQYIPQQVQPQVPVQRPPTPPSHAAFDTPSAERAAQTLQSRLLPPPPESLPDLATTARTAVANAASRISIGGPSLDSALDQCVKALRSLLLASAPPSGGIPHTLWPKGAGPSGAAGQAMAAAMKPAQRRVTATLSKLVLAALAASYDSSSTGQGVQGDAAARMEADATELEHALGAFVLEVQRANTNVAPAERTLGKRRLRGAFLPGYVGAGLVGAGAAGGWRGFGFVAVGEGEEGGPGRDVGDVMGEIRRAGRAVEEGVHAVRVDPAANALALVSSVQSFTDLMGNVNVAKSVDVDGVAIQGEGAGPSSAYRASVLKARSLMRTLEASFQALHDDTLLLLLHTQTLLSLPPPNPHQPFLAPSTRTDTQLIQSHHLQQTLAELSTLIRSHTSTVVEALDGLVQVGGEQKEKEGREWRGSIEWRASRLLAAVGTGAGDPFALPTGAGERDTFDMLAYSNATPLASSFPSSTSNSNGNRNNSYADYSTSNGAGRGLGRAAYTNGLRGLGGGGSGTDSSDGDGDGEMGDDVVGFDFVPTRTQRSNSTATTTNQPQSAGYGRYEPSSSSSTTRYQGSSETPTIVEDVGAFAQGMGSTSRSRRRDRGSRSGSSNGSWSERDSYLGDDDGLAPPPSAQGGKSPSRSKAADKLLRVLGDAPAHIIDKLNAESKPWYLRADYEEGKDVIIDPVRGGTVPALVERLTAHEHTDTSFTKTFLMTFKSFIDVDGLVDLLIERFWIAPPEGLTKDEAEEWRRLKQHIIRTRVLNTFKTMILDDDVLEEKDMYVLDRLADFVRNDEAQGMAAGKQLLVQIERTRNGDSARAKTTISYDPQPTPIVPRSNRKPKLLEFDPLEVARQLTIIENNLFLKIKASECLTRSREQKGASDNISAAIETSNKIAHWVADAVLDKEDARKRALIVKHFIQVADRCRDLRNFSSMIAIVSGLNSPPVRRLKRTWDQISQKFAGMLSACEMTIDSGKNFNNYRQLLQRITPPCVPFIGVYLTTLTFIQDGAPNLISGNLVNFRKRAKAAEVIQEIQKWQSKPFNFARVELIADYLHENLNKFNDVPDVSDVFWNRSLEREPREREDEKMARLLQETGFFVNLRLGN